MSEFLNNNQETGLEETIVSPDQMALFEEASLPPAEEAAPTAAATVEEPTRMEIPLDQTARYHFEESVSQTVTSDTETPAEEEVSGARKVKILAALAIVAVAGYVAYWVQEPVQIRADVTSLEMAGEDDDLSPALTSEEMVTADSSLLAQDTTLSATSGMPSGPTYNVDVSLFGFEPATLQIEKSATVIWTNTSPEDQTIVGSSEDGQSFVSPVLTSGQSFSYQFDQDSTFQYYSTYNPALKAMLTVGSGGQVTPPDAAMQAGAAQPAGAMDSGAAPAADQPAATLENAIAETRPAASEMQPDLANPLITGQQLTATANTDPGLTTVADLKPAADENSPAAIAKTGPEDLLYLVLIFGLGWLNRKKLLAALRRY